MRNAGLDEAQAGTKIAGRNISNPKYTDGITDSMDMGLGELWELVMDRDT